MQRTREARLLQQQQDPNYLKPKTPTTPSRTFEEDEVPIKTMEFGGIPSLLIPGLATSEQYFDLNNSVDEGKRSKHEKKKKSKWSSWSIVDVSIGDYEEMLLDKAKGITTKGITLGSDRKIGDDKFFGLALRYGNGSSNIRRTVQNVDLEELVQFQLLAPYYQTNYL